MKRLFFLIVLFICYGPLMAQEKSITVTPVDTTFRIVIDDDTRMVNPVQTYTWERIDSLDLQWRLNDEILAAHNLIGRSQYAIYLAQRWITKIRTAMAGVGMLNYDEFILQAYFKQLDGTWTYKQVPGSSQTVTITQDETSPFTVRVFNESNTQIASMVYYSNRRCEIIPISAPAIELYSDNGNLYVGKSNGTLHILKR